MKFSAFLLFICLALSFGLHNDPADASRPPVPPEVGNPQRPRGEASRGDCPNVAVGINPIVPDDMGMGGYTTANHPILWIYTPYTLNVADANTGLPNSAVFRLETLSGEEVYQSTISKAFDTPGVIGLSIPGDAPTLELGETYFWYVRVFCNSLDPIGMASTAFGWVQRVEPGTVAPENLWYDRLTEYGNRLQANPNDAEARSHWNELLESVDVEGLVDMPILP